QLLHRYLGAEPVHLRPQPAEQPRELAAGKLLIERRKLSAQALVELGGNDGTEGVGGEVAKGADGPVNVLQAPLEVIRRTDSEPLLHAGVPGLREVPYRELSGEQLLLQLIAQHDVQRIGELVRIDTDQPALHPRQMAVDVLDVPLRPARAE